MKHPAHPPKLGFGGLLPPRSVGEECSRNLRVTRGQAAYVLTPTPTCSVDVSGFGQLTMGLRVWGGSLATVSELTVVVFVYGAVVRVFIVGYSRQISPGHRNGQTREKSRRKLDGKRIH